MAITRQRRWPHVPLKVQVGVVVALFVAAMVSLWTTWARVVEREGQRSTTRGVLDRAGAAMAAVGANVLAVAPRWPYTISQHDWDELDHRLAREADAALRPFDGVEGGYYLRDSRRFLGTSEPPGSASSAPRPKPRPEARKGRRRPPLGPPPREAGLIESQVEAAIDTDQVLFIVKDVPPSTVAIRTAPVRAEGRIVAATWTMIRLVDPLFLDRSIRGYRRAAALALGGIVLALALMAGLARTIRRQAIERDRLQSELRRSERLAALGKLLAGVAHEVRNPLAGIRSTVQLWQRGIGPDVESFDDLLAEVDRIEGIVARLLQFSRAEAQELAPGDLNVVIREAARLARGAAAAGKLDVQIELDLDPSLPWVAMAPPALLQVFRNLTTNALQAMPGGGLLRLSSRRRAGDEAVEASVADTGPGLAAELLDHLFEPFYTTRSEGTGLGLAIAHEIALAHRGSLQAENRPGGPGARFRLVLPASGPGSASRPVDRPGRTQKESPTMTSPETILVADDDRTIRRNLVRLLEAEGFATLAASDGDEALERIRVQKPDAVLLDLKMPGRGGLDVLASLGPILGDLPVIVLTAFGGSAAAIEAMRRGAYDYLAKPFDLDEVVLTLRRALRQRALAAEVRTLRALREEDESRMGQAGEGEGEPELVGRSGAIREVFKAIGRAAATDEPVLIVGESGTGKELVASALHTHSRRGGGPFVRVNCGALPEGLVESELFGHERGAFTGADRQRPGRFERADGGTIFLDEVGELPLSAQAKVLRVLQRREFERVGGTETLRSDARVVSATHRDLPREIAEGRFREDLFYRLNVVRIAIPPLRERPEDIPPLAEQILRRLERKYGWSNLSLTPEAREAIQAASWPGNVRQLENTLARAAIAARGRAILPDHLDVDEPNISASPSPPPPPLPLHESPDLPDTLPLRALLAEVERGAIRRALLACGGNRTRTAERLGISRRQLFDKIREYDLET